MAKTIQLLGEEVNISFNLACQIAYEKITEKAFDPASLNMIENQVALYFACIITENPNTSIKIEQIMRECSIDDYHALEEAVSQSMSEWYKISPQAKFEEGTDNDEDKPKNA